MENKVKKQFVILLISFILGLVISLQIKTGNIAAGDSRDLVELQNNVKSYAEKNRELNQRNEDLYAEIEKLRESRSEGDSAYQNLVSEREKYAIFAGLTDVQNSGVIITMNMSGEAMINDSMIRIVVNELNAVGAQAISINEQRKVTTTEIRTNGENMIINGLSFPRSGDFVIKAIIDSEQIPYAVSMLESLKTSLLEALQSEQILNMTIAAEENVLIPALSQDSIAYKTNLLEPVPEE